MIARLNSIRRTFSALDKCAGSHKTGVFIVCLVLLGAILTIDAYTPAEIPFVLFYLLPISIATWHLGLRMGVVYSVVSALCWHLIHLSWSPHGMPMDLWRCWNAIGNLGIFITMTMVVDKLRARTELAESMARTDSLTGITNRLAFAEIVKVEIERVRRHPQPFSLAMVDFDNFKQINETFGHKAGDRALCTLSDVLRRTLRATDVIARLGGDEFAILLPVTDREKAELFVARLRKQFVHAMQIEKLPITMSIGVFTCNTAPEDIDTALGGANRMIFQAKRLGKDQSCFAEMDAPEAVQTPEAVLG